MSLLPKEKRVEILVTAVISIIATLIASYILYFLTFNKADVKYEVLPVTSFVSPNNSLTILNIQISNLGNKEADDIKGVIKILGIDSVIDQKTVANPSLIQYSFKKDTGCSYLFDCPMLNDGESITISILCAGIIKKENVDIQLRGRGIKIEEKEPNHNEEKRAIFLLFKSSYPVFFSILFILITIFFFFIYLTVTRRRFKHKIGQLEEKIVSQQSIIKNQQKHQPRQKD